MISRKRFFIIIGILAVIIATFLWATFSRAAGAPWDVSYRMTNSGIEWTGAGYSGIYAR